MECEASVNPVVGVQVLLPREMLESILDDLERPPQPDDGDLGTLLRGFSFALPGHPEAVVHFRVVNYQPSPLLHVYVMVGDRIVDGSEPVRDIERTFMIVYAG